jgi:hypothetical protein
MTPRYARLPVLLATLLLAGAGCARSKKKPSKSGSSEPGQAMSRLAVGARAPCPQSGLAPIDCPLRNQHAMGHGAMGHGHGDKHRPFGSVEQYIAHLDRKDRDTWQKPEAVIARLGLAPRAVVADVGAGSGYFALRLARHLPRGRVLAIDLEPDILGACATITRSSRTPIHPGSLRCSSLHISKYAPRRASRAGRLGTLNR